MRPTLWQAPAKLSGMRPESGLRTFPRQVAREQSRQAPPATPPANSPGNSQDGPEKRPRESHGTSPESAPESSRMRPPEKPEFLRQPPRNFPRQKARKNCLPPDIPRKSLRTPSGERPGNAPPADAAKARKHRKTARGNAPAGLQSLTKASAFGASPIVRRLPCAVNVAFRARHLPCPAPGAFVRGGRRGQNLAGRRGTPTAGREPGSAALLRQTGSVFRRVRVSQRLPFRGKTAPELAGPRPKNASPGIFARWKTHRPALRRRKTKPSPPPVRRGRRRKDAARSPAN